MRKDNSIFCHFESGFIANLIMKHCFFFSGKFKVALKHLLRLPHSWSLWPQRCRLKRWKGQVTEPLIFKQWLWILEISGSNLLIVPIHWSGFPLPDFIIILVQLTVFSPNSTLTFSCFVFFIIMVIITWVSVWYQSYLVNHVKKVSMDN